MDVNLHTLMARVVKPWERQSPDPAQREQLETSQVGDRRSDTSASVIFFPLCAFAPASSR